MGRRKKGGNIVNEYLFMTTNISTQPNIDPMYEEIGIIHQTETAAINLLRGAVTNFANVFGAKGIDTKIYDELRNTLLDKIEKQVKEISDKSKLTLKVSNLRMDIDIQEAQLIMTAYGTLMSQKTPKK